MAMGEGAQPWLPDIGVVAMVPDTWGGVWMPRHHVMTLLARYFHVVWMDPPREWREWWLGRGAPMPSLNPHVPAIPGFSIYRPSRWLPLLYRPRALADLTRRLRLRHGVQRLRGAGARRILLYVWRPEFGFALDLLPGVPVCYHIDDEYTFEDHDQPITPEEERLLRDAARVIIHSPALFEKKGHVNPSTLVVPNGVDYRAFATPAPEPDDLRRVPRPRAGYVGVVKRQLDFGLLLSVAERLSDWSFVLVGPRTPFGEQAPLVDRLEHLPNVHFLGGKPVEALPAYAQHCDVAIMPYEITDYTNFIYPLKLHEYLASGRPVVGTPIRTLQEFRSVVALARTPEEWVRALTAGLGAAQTSPEAVEARRALARRHDWGRLVGVVARSLCELLGPADVQRFDDLPGVDLP
jgi:glycosyltransferase involved in cell wall biosynthesis